MTDLFKNMFVKFEKLEENEIRVIVFDVDEKYGHASVENIFWGEPDDVWHAVYDKFPYVNRVQTSNGVEECDCLTLREAAEATDF